VQGNNGCNVAPDFTHGIMQVRCCCTDTH
jgi:hypothetical protein